MKKRIFMLLLAVTVLLGALTLTVSASEIKVLANGTCGENLTWTLDSAGTLTISGTGAMENYDWGEAPWYSYRENILSVVVDEDVTSIGNYAFYRCDNLSSITFPDSVTSIGDCAFFHCLSLGSITLPDRVTSIGDYAFDSCSSLSSITLSENLTTIGNYAFSYCDSLSSITIPDSVTSIGDQAFSDCRSLSSITLSESLTTIGELAFSSCRLTSITLPETLTSIGAQAFFSCDLTSVMIPNSVASIGFQAFTCRIEVDDGNRNYSSDDHGVLFDKNKSILLQAPGAIEGHYSIPDTVITIAECAFQSCDELTSITIPNGVTSIGNNAFHYCFKLTSVIIPTSVTSIGDNAFVFCENLTSVTIPEGITSIGSSVFSMCTSLSSITIPDSVTSIGVWAFYGCESLSTVHYAGTEAQRTDMSIDISNEYLTGATWHYECDGVVCTNPETPPTEPEVTEPEATEPEVTEPKATEPEVTEPDATEPEATEPEASEPEATEPEDTNPAENPFADITTDAYYFTPVLWAVEKGITNGLSADTFGPDATCTRAQIVTFLWRANGSPEPKSDSNPFQDVNSGDYFYNAVLWAVENGITSGMGDGSFAPGAPCTRGQVATFLWRSQGQPSVNGENIFTDIAPGAYYYDAVLWAVENSITNGMGDGTFAPDAPCTRGQIVTFLYRAMA